MKNRLRHVIKSARGAGPIALFLVASTIMPAPQGHARATPDASYRVRRDYSTAEQRGRDGEATTEDQDALVVHVVAIRPEGLELVYDLLPNATPGERGSEWHFPAHVLRPMHGPLRLLNRTELSRRIGPWLKSGELTRAACDHLIFTWTAIRIDCDPDTVLETIEAIDPAPFELREGAPYSDPESRETAPLHRTEGRGGAEYTATLPVDPDVVRRREARTDVSVGELTGKHVTFEAALASRAMETITGTVQVTYVPDDMDRPRDRIRVVRLTIVTADGLHSTRTATEKLAREPL